MLFGLFAPVEMIFHKEKELFQYHQFHFLQLTGHQVFADDTALSLQFHFRHTRKSRESVSPVSLSINVRISMSSR
jgi:hypothetical protein